MTLTPPESRSFFKMYLPLLHYAYSSKHADVTFRQFKSLKIAEKISAQEILFDEIDLIDKHIADNRFDSQRKDDLLGIKKHVRGRFFVLKHLSRYSVFMKTNKRKLYGVIGLSDELGVVLPFVPILINGVLFNFRNKLVCDGLITLENVSFGPGIRRGLNEEYKVLKEIDGISVVL